jgi:hypothetical protein
MLYWQLYNGVFQIPRGIIATDRITGIKVQQTHYGGATGYGNPETLTIK